MTDPRPDPNWRPPGAPTPQNRFFEKLGVYALGIAIGLMLLGWMQAQKRAAVRAEQQAKAPPSDIPAAVGAGGSPAVPVTEPTTDGLP